MHTSDCTKLSRKQPEPLSYTIQGAMGATGLGRSKIYELVREQRLVRIHVGRRALITGESLRALIGGAS